MNDNGEKIVPIEIAKQPIDKLMLMQQRLDTLMKERMAQQANYLGQSEQLKALRREIADSEKVIIYMNGEIGELERTIKFLKES